MIKFRTMFETEYYVSTFLIELMSTFEQLADIGRRYAHSLGMGGKVKKILKGSLD